MSKTNNLICDLETGVCGPAGDDKIELIDLKSPKKTIDLYYVTDPICSHCWALEPTLRRFKEEYGHYFNFHIVMGGLLEKWGDKPVDPANGISGPADVAGHWREVGESSRMPIDGTIMIENPVQSSYPPSRVFKLIQKYYGSEKAEQYLRRAREALFAFNQNIAENSVMTKFVNQLGLDGERIITEAESQLGKDLLTEDFMLAAKLGVRGFPTIIMVNRESIAAKIVGTRSLDTYVSCLSRILKEEVQAAPRPLLAPLLEKEHLLFAKEIEVMYDVEQTNLQGFVESQLPAGSYEQHELFGETYFIKRLFS